MVTSSICNPYFVGAVCGFIGAFALAAVVGGLLLLCSRDVDLDEFACSGCGKSRIRDLQEIS